MIALIAGLGLIGGSMARALTEKTDYTVIGYDRDLDALRAALDCGAIHAPFLPEDLPEADLVLVALKPSDAVDFLKRALPRMKRGALAADLCGIKRWVVREVEPAAWAAGVQFVGAHPMAGREVSGFQNSSASLFDGASLIMTPANGRPGEATERLSALALQIGFGRTVVCTPAEHDRMVAYTSQLAHVTSSAYVMSPAAPRHAGFSAGSFRDMTRVARLDAGMWTELFDLNRDALSEELGGLIERLNEIKSALDSRDGGRMRELLQEGNYRKLMLIEKEGGA